MICRYELETNQINVFIILQQIYCVLLLLHIVGNIVYILGSTGGLKYREKNQWQYSLNHPNIKKMFQKIYITLVFYSRPHFLTPNFFRDTLYFNFIYREEKKRF